MAAPVWMPSPRKIITNPGGIERIKGSPKAPTFLAKRGPGHMGRVVPGMKETRAPKTLGESPTRLHALRSVCASCWAAPAREHNKTLKTLSYLMLRTLPRTQHNSRMEAAAARTPGSSAAARPAALIAAFSTRKKPRSQSGSCRRQLSPAPRKRATSAAGVVLPITSISAALRVATSATKALTVRTDSPPNM